MANDYTFCFDRKDRVVIRQVWGTVSLDQSSIKSSDALDRYLRFIAGGGQFYVWETGRHFISADAVMKHKKSRMYRRRLEELKQEQYTQGVAEMAAGKTKEVLPPAHPELAAKIAARKAARGEMATD